MNPSHDITYNNIHISLSYIIQHKKSSERDLIRWTGLRSATGPKWIKEQGEGEVRGRGRGKEGGREDKRIHVANDEKHPNHTKPNHVHFKSRSLPAKDNNPKKKERKENGKERRTIIILSNASSIDRPSPQTKVFHQDSIPSKNRVGVVKHTE